MGLHWREVALADPVGPRVRVCDTWVLGDVDSPKSRTGFRTIELSPSIADELFEHRRRTAYSGDDDFVFCSPTKGTPIDPVRYAETLRLALARAKIKGYVRPFQDWRHTSLTNGAAAGEIPAALQKRAGHSSYKTTQGYIHLAGVEFPEETKKRTRQLWGESGTKNRYKVDPEPVAGDGDTSADSAQRSGTGVEPA
jgi:integrase